MAAPPDFTSRFGDVSWDASEDILEEKLEQILAPVRLGPLLASNRLSDTLAKIIMAIPADARLVGLSALAAYIDHRPDLSPVIKLPVISLLRALPQLIPTLFGQDAGKDLTETKELIERERQAVQTKLDTRLAYVGLQRTDQIHDPAIHAPVGDAFVHQGPVMEILENYPNNNLCVDCFPRGFRPPRQPQPPPPPSPQPDALKALAEMENRAQAEWLTALFSVLRGLQRSSDADHRGLAERYLALLPGAIATKTKAVIALIPDPMPDLTAAIENPENLLTNQPVMRFLSGLDMDELVRDPSRVEVGDQWNEFLGTLSAPLRSAMSWLGSIWGGNRDDIRAQMRWVRNVVRRLLVLTLVSLVTVLVVAGVFMGLSVHGFFAPSLPFILAGMTGVVLLRYLVQLYDLPIQVARELVDFLDPTDGTGAIGGTIRSMVDWFSPNREKVKPEDREPITWFTDKAISVSLVWGLLSAAGCYWATILDPETAPPAAALTLAGIMWLYVMLETIRKGWRLPGKHDEKRIISLEQRKTMYQVSLRVYGGLGVVSLVLGLTLGLFKGVANSKEVIIGARELHIPEWRVSASAPVPTPVPNRDCAEGLRKAAAAAKQQDYTVEHLCRVIMTSSKFPDKFPCDCPR